MILYHGTNTNSLIDLIDNPKLGKCINGDGFYLTPEIEVAKKYGRTVLAYELSTQVCDSIAFTIRPIDLSFIDGIVCFGQAKEGGMEWVITNQPERDTLALDADSITVHFKHGATVTH